MASLRTALCAAACLLAAACVPNMDKLRELADKPVVYDSNIDLQHPAFVACRDLALHQAPDRWSVRQAVLPFGSAVMPVDYAGYYPLPQSQQERFSGRDLPPEPKMGATWVKVRAVGTEGWAAAACLVDSRLMERQDPNSQLRNTANTKMRNFSEEEHADLTTMQGGVGAAKLASCKTGCKGQDIVDRLILDSAVKDSLESTRTFRSEGRLGEYK